MNNSNLLQFIENQNTEITLMAANNSETELIHKHLNRFESLKEYPMVVIAEVLKLQKNNQASFLPLLSLNYSVKQTKIPIHEENFAEFELVGICELRKDYGMVIIRPETIVDKIVDWFVPVEIDFDIDPDFSEKYYVLTNDDSKLKRVANKGFLTAIKNFDGLEIEINGSILMVRLRKPFTTENAKTIIGFLAQINDGIN